MIPDNTIVHMIRLGVGRSLETGFWLTKGSLADLVPMHSLHRIVRRSGYLQWHGSKHLHDTPESSHTAQLCPTASV